MNPSLDERVRQAAQALIAAGAREVFLFGSAATGNRRERSDIDLAVTGLPGEAFFRVTGEEG